MCLLKIAMNYPWNIFSYSISVHSMLVWNLFICISWLSGVIFALLALIGNVNQYEKDTQALSHTINFHGKKHFVEEKKKCAASR